MARVDRVDDCHRRTFLRSTIVTASGATLFSPAANAREHRKSVWNPPDPPLPPGVLRRFGSARFRSPVDLLSLKFTLDSKRLIGCGYDPELPGRVVSIWDVESGVRTATIEMRIEVLAGETLSFPGTNGSVWQTCPTGTEVLLTTLGYNGIWWFERLDSRTGEVLDRTRMKPPGLTNYRNPNGRTILGFSRPNEGQQTISCYVVPTGEELWKLPSDAPAARNVTFSQDGRTVLFDMGKGIRLVDAATGKHLCTLDGIGTCATYKFGPDSQWVVYTEQLGGGKPAEFRVWDLVTGKTRPLEGCSPRDRLVHTTDTGIVGEVRSKTELQLALWDPFTGKKVRDLPTLPAMTYPLVVAPNGRWGAQTAAGSVAVLDLTSGRPVPTSADPVGDLLELEYLSNTTLTARLCVTGGWTDIRDTCNGGRVTIDTKSGRIAKLPGSDRLESPLDVSNDGRVAVCGAFRSMNSTLAVADPTDPAARRGLKLGFTEGWQTCPVGRITRDNTRFVAPRNDGNAVIVADLATGVGREFPAAVEPELRLKDLMALSRNDRVAVALAGKDAVRFATDYKVRPVVLDLRTGKRVWSVSERGLGTALALSADAGRLAMAALVYTLPPQLRGTTIVNVYDLARNGVCCRLELLGLPDSGVIRGPLLTFSADGRTLVTAVGRTAVAWEVATGKERVRFPHQGEITSATFSPDGRAVAISSRDAPVWEWEFLGTRGTGGALGPHLAWADLAAADAARGFLAVRSLVGSPEVGCELLSTRLPPATAVDPDRVKGLVARLGNDDFRTREAAEAALNDLDGQGLAGYRVDDQPDPEVRARLDRVLRRAARPVPASVDALRVVRAVEAVEALAAFENRPAVKLLERWAGGASEARLTREAVAAMLRLQAWKP